MNRLRETLNPRFRTAWTMAAALIAIAGCSGGDPSATTTVDAQQPPGIPATADSAPAAADEPTEPTEPTEPVVEVETGLVEGFEDWRPGASPAWVADDFPNDGPFSDNGVYFQAQGVRPPAAFRSSFAFGEGGWLTAELYSRSDATLIEDLFSVVTDPAGGDQRVLRLACPTHTDAVVVRPSEALPRAYRVSARVGYADFGDGIPGANGYDGGDETSEPWNDYEARKLNGFYWLSILDALPRPHNNVWLHHHRKVTIDSCNHFPAWMEIYNGRAWKKSGVNPVMMFVLDGIGGDNVRMGKPFVAYSGGEWQPTGQIRAVDAYLPNKWYEVAITRRPPEFTLEVSGEFKFGGQTTYTATIDYEKLPVWHFNQPGEQTPAKAIDNGFFEGAGPEHPRWPEDGAWPDYFMLGQPHNNFYEGTVYYDDIRLERL